MVQGAIESRSPFDELHAIEYLERPYNLTILWKVKSWHFKRGRKMELLKLFSALELLKLFAEFLVSLAGVITASIVIYNFYKKATLKILEAEFESIKKSNDKKIEELWSDMNKQLEELKKNQKELEEKQEEAAIEACKNFLVHAMNDIKKGADDEVLKERIHDAHKWYRKHKQNSYVDARFDELVREGKL